METGEAFADHVSRAMRGAAGTAGRLCWVVEGHMLSGQTPVGPVPDPESRVGARLSADGDQGSALRSPAQAWPQASQHFIQGKQPSWLAPGVG